MKHTPGPWQWEDEQLFVHEEASGATVARVCDDDGYVSCPHAMPMSANARLIAAAPELLETLESVVKVCDDLGRDGVFSHVMAQARAAIAKATGQ